MARRRLTSTIGSVASVWRDPNAKAEEPEPEYPMRVMCSLCPDFNFIGSVAEGRQRFYEHLRDVHPEVDPNPARGSRKPDTRKA